MKTVNWSPFHHDIVPLYSLCVGPRDGGLPVHETAMSYGATAFCTGLFKMAEFVGTETGTLNL